jgi:HD superfamily phosphohydrolase
MDAASQVFDRVFDDRFLDPRIKNLLREHLDAKDHWRQVIRIAALLHDVGHLPFSHAAEKELLPAGWDHERLTAEIIRNSVIKDILEAQTPVIRVEDVVDLAWQVSKRAKQEPGNLPDVWRTLLGEIITGDAFGVDRVDYLLRDALHAGVTYGHFDVHRLFGGLRVALDESENPVLAIEIGSIHAAEALLLARYFMYTQVYMHPLRRVYDEHLKDFLAAWLPGGRFTGAWVDLLRYDDNVVMAEMWRESLNGGPLRALADRIVKRSHFKTAYELNPAHKRLHPDIVGEAYASLAAKFGDGSVRKNEYLKAEPTDFRVIMRDGHLSNGRLVSPDVIGKLPPVDIGLVFVEPSKRDEAEAMVRQQFKHVFEGKKMKRARKKS